MQKAHLMFIGMCLHYNIKTCDLVLAPSVSGTHTSPLQLLSEVLVFICAPSFSPPHTVMRPISTEAHLSFSSLSIILRDKQQPQMRIYEQILAGFKQKMCQQFSHFLRLVKILSDPPNHIQNYLCIDDSHSYQQITQESQSCSTID